MKKLTKLLNEQTEVKGKLQDLSKLDEPTDEQRSEMDTLETRYRGLDVEIRAARIADDEDQRQLEQEFRAGSVDPELRERLELRSKASLGAYLQAALRGGLLSGAEAELQQAAGVDGIPIELWDVPREQRAGGIEHRAVTDAPGTVGVNLQPIEPAVFAPSIAPRLGIDMPQVGTGTFASATISTAPTAGPRAKSIDAPATEAQFAVGTSTPKRIAARLELTLEDVAAVGQENFEPILRQSLSLALSDSLDDQMINGNGVAPNLAGLLQRLTDPSAPEAGVVDFDKFIAAFVGGIDGLWATMAREVAIVAGVATYRLSASTFRDATGQDLGEMAFADYAMDKYGGWWTSSRMPAADNDVQQAILYRMGRSMVGGGPGIRTAVCPHWGQISVDDIYSGSGKGERYFSVHALVGDVILVQPAAYSQVAFRVST